MSSAIIGPACGSCTRRHLHVGRVGAPDTARGAKETLTRGAQKLTAHRPGFEGLNGPDYTTNPDRRTSGRPRARAAPAALAGGAARRGPHRRPAGRPLRRERGQPDSMFAETAPPAGGPGPCARPAPPPRSGAGFSAGGTHATVGKKVGKHSKTRVSDLQGSYTSNVMTKRFAMSRTRSQTFQSRSDGQSLRLGTKRRRRRLLDIRTALDVMKVVHHARS